MLLLTMLAAVTGAEPLWPANAVVLVVAGWCASCHEELTRLDAIVPAADGRRVLVVGLDNSPGTQAMLHRVPPAMRWQPGPSGRSALRNAVYTASAGLPYAVATDPHGRVCADLTLPLDPARTRALTMRCGR